MRVPSTIEQLLEVAAVACAVATVAIVLWYLIRRPALVLRTKLWLLAGLGVLPIAVALTGNYAGYERTKSLEFCGSCHVMDAYLRDATDPKSNSLAAIHSRNPQFGGESCYRCHANFAMFGAVTTKVGGLKHLWYYLADYSGTGPDGEGGPPIKLYEPFDSATCRQCHSTMAPMFMQTHGEALELIRAGEASCIDCHSEIHPTALAHREKPAAAAAPEEPATGEPAEESPRRTAPHRRAPRRKCQPRR